MAYSGQSKIAFDHGFNDALYGRASSNPYDAAVVGKSYQAYEDGYAQGLISDIPPRGPRGEQGEKGDTGAQGLPGINGTNGVDGNWTYVGSGAPIAGLGQDGDQYIDADSGDIYTKVAGTWSFQGNGGNVALTSRVDQVNPDATPEIIYRGKALPGTLITAPSWRIERITIQADGDVETVFADGNDNFDNIWTNRASLSYT